MNAKRVIIGITALIAAAITSAGCYTIIRHPSVGESSDLSESSDTSPSYTHDAADYDCVRCHQDFASYPYGYYYRYYPEYYWTNPRWGDYYAYPWWWDDYWYSSSGSGSADTVNSIDRPEHRRGIVPPYSRGADPRVDPPPFNSGNTTGVTGGSGGTTTGGGTVVTPPGNTNSDDKKEETKPPRRRGK